MTLLQEIHRWQIDYWQPQNPGRQWWWTQELVAAIAKGQVTEPEGWSGLSVKAVASRLRHLATYASDADLHLRRKVLASAAAWKVDS